MLFGFLSGAKALRHVEGVTRDLGSWARRYVSRRAPDTTLSDLIPRLSPKDLREQLITQMKSAWRAKELTPVGLPCGVITFDGKGTGALTHDACGSAQKNHRDDGSEYFLSRMFRAVLTSAESRPCLDQMSIGAHSNEVAEFGRFYDRLLKSYGGNNDLFEIVDVDAGMTSKGNADLIHESHKAYVMALKENQPELLAEAHRLLGNLRKPEAETPWECYKGRRIQRRFFRTTEIAGYHDWQHLKQVWRVEQITKDPNGKEHQEDRYFLTSLHSGRLTATQSLHVVRSHWRVENDCFWSLDMQWMEDSHPWCTTGLSVEILSWIRLMAYNLLQFARRRTLRKHNVEAPPPWHDVFSWVRQALQLESPVFA